MNALVISQVDASRLDALSALSQHTFLETFADANTSADMARYLAENFNGERLAAELHDPGSTFFFAEQDGLVIGYLKLNTGSAQTEPMAGDSMEVERIYVVRARQGEGVGQALLDHAMAQARQQGIHEMWLGVWEHNPRAIAFYRRNGFEEFGDHVFMLGKDEQRDVLMRRRVGDDLI